jgi:hypothetical protein
VEDGDGGIVGRYRRIVDALKIKKRAVETGRVQRGGGGVRIQQLWG